MTVIVFDLDGTLLDSSNQIIGGKETINLLKLFQRKKYKLAICTGRLDHDIIAITEKIGLKIDQRISENGAVYVKDNVVNATVLDKKEALRINLYLEKFSDIRVEMNTVSNRYWKTLRELSFPKEFYDSSIIKENFSQIIQYQPIVLFLIIGKKDRLKEIKKYIMNNYSNISAILTSDSSLELVSCDVSKGNALRKMYHGEMVYSIGDSESDLTMREYSTKLFYIGKEKRKNAILVSNITEALHRIWEEENESPIFTTR